MFDINAIREEVYLDLKSVFISMFPQPENRVSLYFFLGMLFTYYWWITNRKLLAKYCDACARKCVQSKDFRQVFAIHECYGLDIIQEYANRIQDGTDFNMNIWRKKSWPQAWKDIILTVCMNPNVLWSILRGPH